MLEDEAGGLVDGGELGQVAGVGAGGAQDEPGLVAQRALAEEEDHDEGVGEADLCAVDGAVARALDDGQGVVVRRLVDDALQRRAQAVHDCCFRHFSLFFPFSSFCSIRPLFFSFFSFFLRASLLFLLLCPFLAFKVQPLSGLSFPCASLACARGSSEVWEQVVGYESGGGVTVGASRGVASVGAGQNRAGSKRIAKKQKGTGEKGEVRKGVETKETVETQQCPKA